MRGRVLLTGATGLVGPDLATGLAAAGYAVHCLGRRPPPPGPGVTWAKADLTDDPGPILDAVPDCEFVVHAAAARTGEPADLHPVNVRFTDALFAWAGARRAAAVVYVSGFNVLRRPLAPVITEDHPVGPTTAYGETKLAGERLLIGHADRAGFRPVTLRLPSPVPFAYDRLHATVLKAWIDRARAGQPLVVHGRGERAQDFVATTDAAAAVVAALERPAARGIYNVASGTMLTMRELAELIAARWPVPVRLEGDDPNAGERWNIAIDRARADLGYQPRYTARGAVERLVEVV